MTKGKDPSPAEIVAGVISGTAKTKSLMLVRPISYRIPITTLARVDAMAAKPGKSRNAMLNLLLDVGIDEVYKHFSQEEIEELQSREIMAFQDLGGSSEALEE